MIDWERKFNFWCIRKSKKKATTGTGRRVRKKQSRQLYVPHDGSEEKGGGVKRDISGLANLKAPIIPQRLRKCWGPSWDIEEKSLWYLGTCEISDGTNTMGIIPTGRKSKNKGL